MTSMTKHLRLSFVSLISTLAVAPSVFAASDTWVPTAAGPYGWNDPANWATTTQFPNGIDDVANVNINTAGAQTIELNEPITVGTLNLGDSTTAFFAQTIAAGTVGSITFDVSTGSAVLGRTVTVAPGMSETISAGITLNDDLIIRVPYLASANRIALGGVISGT